MIAEVSDIQNFMFYIFRTRGHYLNKVDGGITYPIEFIADTSLSHVAIIFNEMIDTWTTTYPQSLNSHYFPSGLPTNSFYARLKMKPNTNFHKLIGVASDFLEPAGYSSPSNPSTTKYSSVCPELNPDANLVVNLGAGMIDNQYSNPFSVIHSFSINVSPSGQQTERPNEVAFVDIAGGRYDHISLSILNAETLADVSLFDPEISILLLIKDKKE